MYGKTFRSSMCVLRIPGFRATQLPLVSTASQEFLAILASASLWNSSEPFRSFPEADLNLPVTT